MPKLTVKYVCQECGSSQFKWIGRCPACGGWNTLVEEVDSPGTTAAIQARGLPVSGPPRAYSLDEVSKSPSLRLSMGLAEMDRVLGGGIVPGSLVLVGGEPGIGKSTLILQACQGFAVKGRKVLYVSGEESLQQIQLRAARLGLSGAGLRLLSETCLERILDSVPAEDPALVVIDSIQTLFTQDLAATAGTVSQVRECTVRLMAMAKSKSLAVILVGHVTKDGGLAGPKVLEHLVDTVLTFEGDAYQPFRVLRAAKNRFGNTQESGLFEMGQTGLTQVENPSAWLLKERGQPREGSAALACLEGSRSLLVEVQALVTPTHYGTPQRSSAGVDPWRLSLLYAVLEKRCGILLYNQDVFVNVAGGLKVQEPAVDLAVVCAVVSSHRGIAIAPDWVVFGEIGLGGELKPVLQSEVRLKEAVRNGFKHALLPAQSEASLKKLRASGIELHPVPELRPAFAELFGS